MKATVFAIAAAAIATGVSAGKGHAGRRHAHELMHQMKERHPGGTGYLLTGTGSPAEATCGCTTIYTTITGEGTLYFPPAPTTSSMAPPPAVNTSVAAVPTTSSVLTTSSSSSSTPIPSSSSSSSAVITSATSTIVLPVPTPFATTCPTTGVYTIPATTLTLSSSTTVCAPGSTSVPAGTHTIGGVTTVVTTATTVVCPYATVSTESGVVTSTILTTTYVCPSAGTYTIAPITTTVTTDTVCVYPTPVSYAPGTYTQPEIVTTVTKTNYVVYCPFTSSTPAPATSAVYVAPTSTSVYVAPASTSEAPKSSAVATSSAPKSSSSSPSSSGGSVGSSGEQWGMVYTPYGSSGSCLSKAQVMIDMAAIKAGGFEAVRVYSTDCSALENIGDACKITGLKMIAGVFIDAGGLSKAQEQVTAIANWAQWDVVDLIVVGNEAVFNGYCSASDLATFITSAKSTFSAAGYTGQCTTTEPLNIWQDSAHAAALCPCVDIVGAQLHPFFNADVSADDAGSFTESQLKLANAVCPGKSAINLETGWPSEGSANGKAVPGKSEQSTALAGIKSAVGGKSVILSYQNDMWKQPGTFGCEQYWGAISFFG